MKISSIENCIITKRELKEIMKNGRVEKYITWSEGSRYDYCVLILKNGIKYDFCIDKGRN